MLRLATVLFCIALKDPSLALTCSSHLSLRCFISCSFLPQKECTDGLLKGASTGLKAGGYLFIYGPFALNGLLIPDSNKSFDESLKARSGGSWGIRDVAWVASLADEQGLELIAMALMPANNFFVVFTKVNTSLTQPISCSLAALGTLLCKRDLFRQNQRVPRVFIMTCWRDNAI